MKNLQKLQSERLLKSKSYGLGKEMLWSLKPHSINRDEGYVPPRSEIHTFKYEHEKDCGDVFVALALTNGLYSWSAHTKIGTNVIPDRTAELEKYLHIERERGNQGEAKLTAKVRAYKSYYKSTGKNFNVLFLIDTDEELDRLLRIYEQENVPYFVALFSDFVTSPVETTLHTYRRQISFQTLIQTPV